MILVILLILPLTIAQQEASLTQPPYIETNLLTISNLYVSSTVTTTFTYINVFSRQPLVYLSLVKMESLQALSVSSVNQKVVTVSDVNCEHEMQVRMEVGGINYHFSQIQIMYLAFDYTTYPFIMPCTLELLVPGTSTNQYLKIDYLPKSTSSALNSSHDYFLQAMLTGFINLTLAGQPSLYLDAIQYNNDSYLVSIKRMNASVDLVQVLRVLIDKTVMLEMATTYTDLVCSTGTIVHKADPLTVDNNPAPFFLPFAMLYGVKGWLGTSFNIPALTYIFNNSNPRVELNIGYILFQTKVCPSNQLYVQTQNLCYGLSASFYYQLTPQTMAPCPTTCYTCVGPLSTNCQSCVQGWNRELSGGRCVCISGFYDPGGPICKNCTQAISGCKTCNSATNCQSCLPGCTAIGFSPIYCDCPGFVQSNYSYNCPQSYYYQHDSQQCQCLPQTYLDSVSNLCFPCETGCYICVSSADYCLVCIDSYILIGHSCVFYYNSYALLGQGNSLNSPWARCLRWDGSECMQTCSKYYVGFNCYGACPKGTFNISFPWMTCQPCKLSCNYCFNFTVCYDCNQQYYYFNSTTFACNRCGQHCLTCYNDTHCKTCEKGYNIDSYTCLQTAVAGAVCGTGCKYCLMGNQCLICQQEYYLNQTDYLCYQCNDRKGFVYEQASGCREVCGDNVRIFAQCDDGNVADGDGCSSLCEIEDGFKCWQEGRSLCWSQSRAIEWHVYSIIGKNQIIVEIDSSEADLSQVSSSLQCFFSHSLLSFTSSTTHNYYLSFNQSLTLPASLSQKSTLAQVRNTNASNRCLLTINHLFDYTLAIDSRPELLLVDFQEGWMASVSSPIMKLVLTVVVYLSVAVAVLGVVPASGYVSLRVNVILLITFLDCLTLPVNSLSMYQALQSLFFLPSSSTTKQLTNYDQDQVFTMLWHSCTAYIVIIFFYQFIFKFIAQFMDNTGWNAGTQTVKHIINNKHVNLGYLTSAYDMLAMYLIFKVLMNAGQADYRVLVLMVIQVGLVVAGKVHFFRNNLSKDSFGYLGHAILVDQLLNFNLPLTVLLASNDISYSAVVLALFSCYSIASIAFSQPATLDPQFKLTSTVAAYQYSISQLLVLAVQGLKCTNNWRNSSWEYYQSLSIALGLAICLLCSITMVANSITTTTCVVIKVWEVMKEPSSEALEQVTVENASGQIWSVTS